MTKKKKNKRRTNIQYDHLELFRLMMYDMSGITYPKRIFDRRINLMTEKEFEFYSKKIWDLYEKIDQEYHTEIEEIDSIMSRRAEIENDEWK